MQSGITNIIGTGTTVTTLIDEDLGTTSVRSITMTNTHPSTAVTVELYIQDRTAVKQVLSTLVDVANGTSKSTVTFNSLTGVEVGDTVEFYHPVQTNNIIPQVSDTITVVDFSSANVAILSSVVIAHDNAGAKFNQLERAYIVKTDIPGQTTLELTNIPTVDNIQSTLGIKTTSSGMQEIYPLTVIIK